MDRKQNFYPQSEEIDLMDYIEVILKNKWLILGVFLVAVISVGIFNLLMPKVYQIDTSLEIGRVEGQLVEELAQVIEKINGGIYGKLEYPGLKAENPKGTNLVKIKMESPEPQKAKETLVKVSDLILKEHQEKLEEKKIEIERSIKEIQEELSFLKAKKQYSEGIAELQIELSRLKERLNGIENTRVVKAPTISKEPVEPKIKLNIAIAGVLGLFLGVFLAFFRVWWQKSSKSF